MRERKRAGIHVAGEQKAETPKKREHKNRYFLKAFKNAVAKEIWNNENNAGSQQKRGSKKVKHSQQ